MTNMKYNINDNVRVILTDRGIEVMKKENPIMFEFHFNPVTKEVNDQLWVIMNTFGKDMMMGVDNVFEKNIMIFEDNKVNEDDEIEGIKKVVEWALNEFKPV